jgi:hypothetical protein
LRLTLLLTFQHRAGVSTYTSGFPLAGTCVCGKQSLGPLFCLPFPLRAFLHFTYSGLSFSRSYGYILPSSLTRVFPRTLGFSPRLPVSVLVRAHQFSLEAFLDSSRPLRLCFQWLPITSRLSRRGFASLAAYLLGRALPIARAPSFCVTPSLKRTAVYRNFNLLSIAYALRLGLGPDLPWDDDRCPGTLRLSVEGFSPSFRYSYRHSHFLPVHSPSGHCFNPCRNAPLPMYLAIHAKASVPYFSPGHFRRRVSRPVSYYALFKWWLLLSQHPGCF